MVSSDRQQVIETNRSLRTIKNELEALLEKGVITEDAFDSIHRLLPAEGTVSHAPAQRAPTALPTPATTPLNNGPPLYAQSTTNNAAPPPLPGRRQPPAAPVRPVIAHCRALYRYEKQDDRDCAFEEGDRIEVYEKMNADWWLGKNLRTDKDGIFPQNYVREDPVAPVAPVPGAAWNNEKAFANNYQQPVTGGYPPPPAQVNPYNAHAPPMAMANNGYGGGGGEEQKPSKTEENGKKIGKKLGNAALFGAGATLGSNLVNSIF
ncbi:SH3-domain-containing protein [Echria macrotheca]|uniref:SH3-domain-containing protein n=1 Tax=Echria macrotheca TaxID=438768 RepID=A0AAJ0F1S6_9PEZI|nr:SH3-domain-containing protein [Echria macrotheca]